MKKNDFFRFDSIHIHVHMISSIYKNMALKNLSSLSRTDYHSFLDSFDTVLTDCDGKLIFYFLTNSSLYRKCSDSTTNVF